MPNGYCDWEYQIEEIKTEVKKDRVGKLNELGSLGWELAHVTDDDQFIFKRPVHREKQSTSAESH